MLDFSTRLPGPVCTQILADLGADVIKVEPPEGDYTRGMQGEFEAFNRNKRSLVVDLKRTEGRAVARALVAGADVVVESFQPGVAARLGIGWARLRRLRPALVYCSISSFGQSGARRARPGHDVGFLALAGALGAPARWSESPPARSPLAVADIVAALYAAAAVEAALLRRAATGRGAHLDLALSAAALAATSLRPTLHVDGGGRRHLSPLNDLFRTRDGRLLALAVIGERFWVRLRDALAPLEPALLEPRFDSEAGRREAGDDLQAILGRLFATRSRESWLRRLRSAGVAAEPVLEGTEPLREPAVRRSGVLEPGPGPGGVRFPVAFDGSFQPVRRAAPRLGQHSREVLLEHGLGAAQVEHLVAVGAVREG